MCFKFFNRLKSNVKLDKKQTEKNNWVFYKNRIQKLKLNKKILVEDNQIVFFRSKDKTCDILTQGIYGISEENLPFLFKRNNIKKIKKSTKIKTDIYYLKKENIQFECALSKKHYLNNQKINESIKAKVIYTVTDIKLHSKFIFLEDAVVTTEEYNDRMHKLIDDVINNIVTNYKGDFQDLLDNEISNNIKMKLMQELNNIGITINQVEFNDYKDLTKYKNVKRKKLEPITKVNVQNNVQVMDIDTQQPNQLEQNEIKCSKNDYVSVLERKSITINPDDIN